MNPRLRHGRHSALWVRHIHFKDSRLKKAPETGQEDVLPGSGEYPAAALRDLLTEVRYPYGVSLEWEKLWHPQLPEIRLALREFQNWIKQSVGGSSD